MPLPPDLPVRMQKLPRWRIMGMDAPVPWFVQWMKTGADGKPEPCEPGAGEPDFRVMDSRKWVRAIRHGRCWVCGEELGIYKAFVIGPMCAVNRVTSEPPCHRSCAIWSAKACPFLSRPRMRRNEKGLPEEHEKPAGFMLERNPGATCIWITRSFRVFNAEMGGQGQLIRLDDPAEVLWFAEGKTASRTQVMESITSGYPSLLELAQQDGPAAIVALEQMRDSTMKYLPA